MADLPPPGPGPSEDLPSRLTGAQPANDSYQRLRHLSPGPGRQRHGRRRVRAVAVLSGAVLVRRAELRPVDPRRRVLGTRPDTVPHTATPAPRARSRGSGHRSRGPHVSTVGLVALASTASRAGGSSGRALFSPDDLGAQGVVAPAPAHPGLTNPANKPQPGPCQWPAAAAPWPASTRPPRCRLDESAMRPRPRITSMTLSAPTGPCQGRASSRTTLRRTAPVRGSRPGDDLPEMVYRR